MKTFLHVGCGNSKKDQTTPSFAGPDWSELRLDIDPGVNPDIVGTMTNMTAMTGETVDAIFSAHNIEHLYPHEVPAALSEFRRVLKPDGFALITSPDLEAIASLILDHGLDHVAYTSPAGPISALDMLFGHSASVANGHVHMAHKCGFTCVSLGQRLVDSGFATVLATRDGFDLWAVALMERADKTAIQQQLAAAGLKVFDDAE